MKTRRKGSKLLSGLLSLVVILGVCFGWGGGVGAADTNTTVATFTFEKGTLTFGFVPEEITFGDAITLAEPPLTSSGNLTVLEVKDFTGTGSGWEVNVHATPFTTTGDILNYGSLLIKEPNSFMPKYTEAKGNLTAPTSPLDKFTVIDTGAGETPGDPIKIIDAAVSTGLGQWNINWAANSIKLEILQPQTIITESTYTSTITWTLISSPE